MFELTELGNDAALLGGRYRLERFVARGGMGQIYAATDTWLSERVAVKLPLADELNHVLARQQLSREARLTRRVKHPGVCRIHGLRTHECGEDSTPMPFLAMDFVEGARLGQRLWQGRLPLAEVTQIARQVLSALAAVHEAGVCHLDLKSDNIILADVGGSYQAIIVDFGLAREVDPHTHGSLHAVAGTPAYMAPEQIFGAAPTVPAPRPGSNRARRARWRVHPARVPRTPRAPCPRRGSARRARASNNAAPAHPSPRAARARASSVPERPGGAAAAA